MIDVFLTNDGSTDDTEERLKEAFSSANLFLIEGDGSLYWNGGMIYSWKAALAKGGYDGYLWLNNDTELFPCLWQELMDADRYSKNQWGQGGIYVGSTWNRAQTKLSYGGFNFTNRWTLKDEFVYPNGTFLACQCAHGNVTYVSQNVVDRQGIFCEKYLHGGGDHDYTYRAHKKGFPVFILRDYVGICENDHHGDGWGEFIGINLRKRMRYVYSPTGFNLHNALLFQKRCFPYRYPFVLFFGYMRIFFPNWHMNIYQHLRRKKSHER
jgi:GT2 family glycosyltransferase